MILVDPTLLVLSLSTQPGLGASFMAQIFSDASQWLRSTVGSRRIQKKLLRSTMTFVVMMVLMLDATTVRGIGQAAVFAGTLSVAMPLFLPISGQLYIMFLLLFWLLVSWAWICAATATAYAARSVSLFQQQIESAQASYVPGTPIAIQTQLLIRSGHFLDPGSSAVFGGFLFVGSFLAGLGLGYRPDMAFVIFFALTVADALFSVNPLLPSPSYISAHTFIPAAMCYAAVSLASMLLIFPESFNHSWIVSTREDILVPVIKFLYLHTSDAVSISTAKPISHLDSVIHFNEQLEGILDLEFSIHRLSAPQLHSLFGHVKRLVYRVKNIEVSQNRLSNVFRANNSPTNSSKVADEKGAQDPYQRILHLSDRLRTACQVSTLDIEEWFRECAMDSWSDVFCAPDIRKIDYRRLRLEISSSNLRKAQTQFYKEDLPEVLESVKPTDSSRKQQEQGQGASMMEQNDREAGTALSLMDDVNLLANDLLAFLSFLIEIEEKEPKPKFRVPHIFTRKKPESENSAEEKRAGEKDSTPGTPATPGTPYPLSPLLTLVSEGDGKTLDPQTPTPQLQSPRNSSTSSKILTTLRRAIIMDAPASDKILVPPLPESQQSRRHPFIKWLLAPETVYALRVALLGVALFIPAVSKATVGLYLSNSGVIALLLGQSYVAIYAGDQIFFFVVRFVGTLLGLLLVVITWFVSAGKGAGNGYVLAVVATICVVPSLCMSMATQDRTWMLFCTLVSTTLVSTIGLIYEELHYFPIGGSTLEVVSKNIWGRLLLDVIGFGASLIIAMLPWPTTARSGFHTKLSESVEQIGMILRNGWEGLSSSTTTPAQDFRAVAIQSITKKHLMLKHFLTSMKFDPRIRSLPSPLYRQVFELQTRLLSSTIHYIEALERLDPAIRSRLFHQTPYVNEDMIARVQYCILRLTRQISDTASLPPPKSLTVLQDELRRRIIRQSDPDSSLDTSISVIHNFKHNALLGLSEEIPEAQMMIFSSVVVNFNVMIESIDEMSSLVPELEPWRKHVQCTSAADTTVQSSNA